MNEKEKRLQYHKDLAKLKDENEELRAVILETIIILKQTLEENDEKKR